MRILICLAIAAAASAAAHAQLPALPAGWERPTDADLAGPDWESRKDKPCRYVCAMGDFDGDGKPDSAEMLVDRKADKMAVFAFMSGHAPIMLTEQNRVRSVSKFGLGFAQPGRHETTCGKGYHGDDPKCLRGIPELNLPNGGIDFFVWESASSIFYWKGSKFEREWTSD